MASPAPNRARARRFRLKVLEPNEGEVMKAVLSALLYHPLVAEAYRMNTGAGRLLFPNGKISRFLHFGKCGSPDIHGYLTNGRALFVEVKSASGTVSDEQVIWIEKAKKHGCAAFVARSVDDVARELKQFKGPTNWPDLVTAKAQEIVAALDAGTYTGPKTVSVCMRPTVE